MEQVQENTNTHQNQNRRNIDSALLIAVAITVVASILFSGKGLLAKAGMAHGAAPLEMLVLRMAYAAPIFALILLWMQWKNRVQVKHLVQSALLGLLGCYLAPLLNFWGLGRVSASLERLLIYACPAFILMFAWMRGQNRLNWRMIMALGLSYAGIVVACLGRDSGKSSTDLVGVIAILVGCVLYSIFVVLGVEIQHKIGSSLFTSTSMLTSSIACLVQAHLTGISDHIVHPSAGIFPIALTLALLCTAIPAYMTQFSIRKLGASRSSILSMGGPIFTLLVAGYWLGESPSSYQIAGLILLLGGSVILTLQGSAKASHAES